MHKWQQKKQGSFFLHPYIFLPAPLHSLKYQNYPFTILCNSVVGVS